MKEQELNSETRITDPETGGQKGVKLERFDLIPVEELEALARVYGHGSKKYSDGNWMKGYAWGLSFGAMMRHAWAFWRGEEMDRESGQPHLAHVAWHCFTLMWFAKHRREKDDRTRLECPQTFKPLRPTLPSNIVSIDALDRHLCKQDCLDRQD